MLNREKPLDNKRIGVFGKGGCGKSTVTVLLAKTLRDQGYHVFLLDADSTNFGLARALGFNKSPTPLMEYFGGMVFNGGAVTCPVDDPTLLSKSDISIDLIPQHFYIQGDEITLFTAGKIGDKGPGAGCDGPVSKIARDIRIHDWNKTMVTLVDFKAGLEDSARGVITSLDWAVVIVDPTLASLEMAKDMHDMVIRIKAGEPPATKHLDDPKLIEMANRIFSNSINKGALFVLNNLQNSDMENYLRMELSRRGIEPIGIIHQNLSIRHAWLKGMPIDAPRSKEEVKKIARAIEDAEARVDDEEANR
jgi:CO dehydrogenase maturation factor